MKWFNLNCFKSGEGSGERGSNKQVRTEKSGIVRRKAG